MGLIVKGNLVAIAAVRELGENAHHMITPQ
jgi:hypothetical protein